MCWLTAWTFSCQHIWTVQSGSCANPFTPACKLNETRTTIPELCRDCRLRDLLVQAPTSHDDIIVEEEEEEEGYGGNAVMVKEKEMRLRGKGEDGIGETSQLLGEEKGRRRKELSGERKGWGGKKGWLRRVW